MDSALAAGWHAVLAWIEASQLGRLMRESGPWVYPLVNLAHVLGVATLFGSVLVIDLRLLGVGRRVPIGTAASLVTPVSAAGLALALATGPALLADSATAYANNPFLIIKFPAIALGLINIAVLNGLPAWKARTTRELSRRERRQLAIMGGLSLASWLTAVVAGRMIAYW